MSRHVNSISGRLSLRTPQRKSLEILHRVMEIAQPHKNGDVSAALSVIRSEFSEVEDFERSFPSLCFALATGVGKKLLDCRCDVQDHSLPGSSSTGSSTIVPGSEGTSRSEWQTTAVPRS